MRKVGGEYLEARIVYLIFGAVCLVFWEEYYVTRWGEGEGGTLDERVGDGILEVKMGGGEGAGVVGGRSYWLLMASTMSLGSWRTRWSPGKPHCFS